MNIDARSRLFFSRIIISLGLSLFMLSHFFSEYPLCVTVSVHGLQESYHFNSRVECSTKLLIFIMKNWGSQRVICLANVYNVPRPNLHLAG